ncbi:hypothetical protein H4R35_001010 [Dimargaris xerosporica]|nr:hypothetical protein H4R35_001010 [Dimargaris xerosporica]
MSSAGNLPPCSVCQSIQFYRDEAGSYVCEFGHEQSVLTERLNYEDFHTDTQRTQKKKRIKQQVPKVLKGGKRMFSLAKAFQYALQKVVKIMINDMGLPDALEDVIKEIWILYCNLTCLQYNTSYEPFGREELDWKGVLPDEAASRGLSEASELEGGFASDVPFDSDSDRDMKDAQTPLNPDGQSKGLLQPHKKVPGTLPRLIDIIQENSKNPAQDSRILETMLQERIQMTQGPAYRSNTWKAGSGFESESESEVTVVIKDDLEVLRAKYGIKPLTPLTSRPVRQPKPVVPLKQPLDPKENDLLSLARERLPSLASRLRAAKQSPATAKSSTPTNASTAVPPPTSSSVAHAQALPPAAQTSASNVAETMDTETDLSDEESSLDGELSSDHEKFPLTIQDAIATQDNNPASSSELDSDDDLIFDRPLPRSRRHRPALPQVNNGFPLLGPKEPRCWSEKYTGQCLNREQIGSANNPSNFGAHVIPAIVYFGCLWLRLPVFMEDIYRWIQLDRLPLRRPLSLLPTKLVSQIGKEFFAAFRPYLMNRAKILSALDQLCLMFRLNYEIIPPDINQPLALHRLIDELSLPVQFYHQAVALIESSQFVTRIASDCSLLPEAKLGAIIVVLIVMHYGLDGTPRVDPRHPSYSRSLPSYEQFFAQFAWQRAYNGPTVPNSLVDLQDFCERHIETFINLSISLHTQRLWAHYRRRQNRYHAFRPVFDLGNELYQNKPELWQLPIPTIPLARPIAESLASRSTPLSDEGPSTSAGVATSAEPNEIDKAQQVFRRYEAHLKSDQTIYNAPAEEPWERVIRLSRAKGVSEQEYENAAKDIADRLPCPPGTLPSASFVPLFRPAFESHRELARPMSLVITRVQQVVGCEALQLARYVVFLCRHLAQMLPLYAEVVSHFPSEVDGPSDAPPPAKRQRTA